jgi:subtilisin family serine protease
MLSATAPGRARRAVALQVRRAVALGVAIALGPLLALAAGAAPARADGVRDAQLWVLDALHVPEAWSVTQGQGVTVAVIDSGVNPHVSDLVGSVITGPNYTGVNTPESNPNWGVHGTWMASLIAGHGHDGGGSGIIGVAPKSRVLSIRVITDSKDPNYARYQREPQSRIQQELAAAIRYAVSHGAQVISMSLGYGLPSLPVRSALQDALNHNVVVVASSGNSGGTAADLRSGHAPYSFPANYPGVLGVAAIDEGGQPAGFSSDNYSVQVAAPGVSVPAQGRDGQYWLVSGTSPACALTAGVAALIRSAYPSLPPDMVREAIIRTTSNRPAGGYDDEVGFGTVDAAAALTAAARLAARGLAGPGSPRTGLRRTVLLTPGVSPAGHFGGGAAAVPAPPIAPRGDRRLVVYCLLAAVCLALIVAAASGLVLMRRPAQSAGYAGTAGYPAGAGLSYGAQQGGPGEARHEAAPPRFPWPATPPGHHTAAGDGDNASGAGD